MKLTLICLASIEQSRYCGSLIFSNTDFFKDLKCFEQYILFYHKVLTSTFRDDNANMLCFHTTLILLISSKFVMPKTEFTHILIVNFMIKNSILALKNWDMGVVRLEKKWTYAIRYKLRLWRTGNWPKRNNALALEIVSLKCNALVIMH